MGGVKLKAPVVGKRTIKVEKKPALWASKCDSCGLVHKMEGFSGNEKDLGKLSGTFDACATGPDGRGLGNMFSATVCSFACADKIMNGGWKKIEEYKPYIQSNAKLVRCELRLTSYIISEKELIKTWEDQKEINPPIFYS